MTERRGRPADRLPDGDIHQARDRLPERERDPRDRRRPMRRLGDVLPEVAGRLGIDGELRRARRMAAWQRLVGELAPRVSGSQLLDIQPPALLVSAPSPIAAQELQLRSSELLAAFAGAPDGVRLVELRVVIRPAAKLGRP